MLKVGMAILHQFYLAKIVKSMLFINLAQIAHIFLTLDHNSIFTQKYIINNKYVLISTWISGDVG